MKVERASYGATPKGDNRLQLTVIDRGSAIQMDIVGDAAFLFRRCFEMGARIEIDGGDDCVTFRRVVVPPVDLNEMKADTIIHSDDPDPEDDGRDAGPPDGTTSYVEPSDPAKLRKNLRKS